MKRRDFLKAVSAGIATIEMIESEGLLENAQRLGRIFRERFEALAMNRGPDGDLVAVLRAPVHDDLTAAVLPQPLRTGVRDGEHPHPDRVGQASTHSSFTIGDYLRMDPWV